MRPLLISLLLVGSCAAQTITLVRHASAVGGTGSTLAVYSSNTAGDGLVAVITVSDTSGGSGFSSGISDAAGNTWTSRGSITVTVGDGTHDYVEVWDALNCKGGGSNTVTATGAPSGTGVGLAIFEFSPITYDAKSTWQSNAGLGDQSSVSTGTVTTTGTKDALVAFSQFTFQFAAACTGDPTQSGTWTDSESFHFCSPNYNGANAWTALNVTPGNYSNTFTVPQNNNTTVAGVVAYKAAATATATQIGAFAVGP